MLLQVLCITERLYTDWNHTAIDCHTQNLNPVVPTPESLLLTTRLPSQSTTGCFWNNRKAMREMGQNWSCQNSWTVTLETDNSASTALSNDIPGPASESGQLHGESTLREKPSFERSHSEANLYPCHLETSCFTQMHINDQAERGIAPITETLALMAMQPAPRSWGHVACD